MTRDVFKLKSWIDKTKVKWDQMPYETEKTGWLSVSHSLSPEAIRILERYPDRIKWYYFSRNPGGIALIEQNEHLIDWSGLSLNPNAVHILERNQDKIDWQWLSSNPNAIHLLERNPDKIDWKQLSSNPNAIHMLERNQDKINWTLFSANPGIFEYDYEYLRARMVNIREELLAIALHPDRVMEWKHKGFNSFD